MEDMESELCSEEVPILQDMTPRHWVPGSRRFEKAYWPHLQQSNLPQRQLRGLETSGT